MNPPPKPLRILFINRMLSMERGGGETFDLEIGRHLAQLGCQITYLSGIPLFGKAQLEVRWSNPLSSCPVAPCPAPPSTVYGLQSRTLRSPYFGWFPWDKVRGGWRLRAFDFYCFERAAFRWAAAHATEFDVIQVCELTSFAYWWRRSGQATPVSVRLTAPNYDDPRGGLPLADAVIASGTSVEKLRARGFDRAVDVPNSVDAAHFHPGAQAQRDLYGLAPDDFVCVYVARFQAFKNHEMLLRAFAEVSRRIPGARLVLAGSGPLLGPMRELAGSLGLAERVLFLGEVSFHELPRLYASADLKVISSDYESFCFAALEAMSTGLPVLTTDCGWVPKLLGESVSGAVGLAGREGGWVTPVGDASALADAICAVIPRADLRKRAGLWNRQRVLERHQWPASAARLLALYREVLERSNRPT